MSEVIDMRKIIGEDKVFENVLNKTDKIIYNLFYLIREKENAFTATDEATYIIGQSNESTPLWMWLKEKPDGTIDKEIYDIVESRLLLNHNLKVVAHEKNVNDILNSIAQKKEVNYKVNMPMTVYACNNVKKVSISGQVVKPKEEHKEILIKFITDMVYDVEKNIMNENDANGFANWAVNADNLYLWENNDAIVSMAMIAHKTNEYARINTVFTEREQRGKGYVGMLLYKLSEMLLKEDIIPMLYADSRNPASNSAYQKIGFEKYGEITEYIFIGG